MDTSTALAWDDRYLVGHHTMDRTHREFADHVNALLSVGDAGVADALAALLAHLEAHFAFEEDLMAQHAFPARGCHADEHAKVLASVHQTLTDVRAGDLAIGRELGQALVDWFGGHADYMDSALATWVVKKTMDGAPVVLRRSMQARPFALP